MLVNIKPVCDDDSPIAHSVQSALCSLRQRIENIKSLYHHSIWRSFGFIWIFIAFYWASRAFFPFFSPFPSSPNSPCAHKTSTQFSIVGCSMLVVVVIAKLRWRPKVKYVSGLWSICRYTMTDIGGLCDFRNMTTIVSVPKYIEYFDTVTSVLQFAYVIRIRTRK